MRSNLPSIVLPRRPSLLAVLLSFVAFGLTSTVTATTPPPRLAVLTDIGGDPDDQQSMVRLMAYANEFRIELLVASAVRTNHAPHGPTTRPDLVRAIVDAYGEVLPNLRQHATGWPTATSLHAAIVSGNPDYGREHIGPDHDTAASSALIKQIDAGSAEDPLNISIWGGQTDLAQALWRVKQDQDKHRWTDFVRKFRVYDIGDQDKLADWMRREFPGMHYILSSHRTDETKTNAVFRGMYLSGDESLTSREWLQTHVTRRSTLGALYPLKAHTRPNPHGAMKEGDTPSWFFFLPAGGNIPRNPNSPGWGGRFTRQPDGWWQDFIPPNGQDRRETVSRWRPAFQKDFARRMTWSESPSVKGAEGLKR